MRHYTIVQTLIVCCFFSCQNSPNLQDLFPIYKGKIVEQDSHISNNDLGLIEGLHCNDSILITLDFHDSKSYSLFDISTGILKKRFGEIGHGHDEIPLGCVGNIWKNNFCVFDDQISLIAKYKLTLSDSKSTYDTKVHYQITDASFTKIVPIDSIHFLGMGVYKDKYQYIIFNNKNNVLDYAFEIYNATDDSFDKYHRHLSNQGFLVKHPKKACFAGAIKRSSNIDFFTLENNQIKKIESLRYHDPLYSTTNVNGLRRVIPSDYDINGFLDLCCTEKFVFALYSEEKQKDCPYYSHIILVFSWKGEPIYQIRMPNEIYYIAANNTKLYTVERNKEGYFIIKSYIFDF